MITSQTVAAEVNGATASISYYRADNRLTITINGCTCQFPCDIGALHSNHTDDTIRALADAIGAL